MRRWWPPEPLLLDWLVGKWLVPLLAASPVALAPVDTMGQLGVNRLGPARRWVETFGRNRNLSWPVKSITHRCQKKKRHLTRGQIGRTRWDEKMQGKRKAVPSWNSKSEGLTKHGNVDQRG